MISFLAEKKQSELANVIREFDDEIATLKNQSIKLSGDEFIMDQLPNLDNLRVKVFTDDKNEYLLQYV